MYLTYKAQENFRETESKDLLNGRIILGSVIEDEGDFLFNDIDCESEKTTNWEEMMDDGVSPLKEIKFQYQQFIPKFDQSFLKSITIFLKNAPKKGAKIINYILKGPLQNIKILDWNNIFEVLLTYLPHTINTISNSLSVEESDNLQHRLIFLKMGGLSLLYKYAKDPDYQLDLSLILKYLSTYKLSNYYFNHIFDQNDQDEILLGTDLNDSISDFINDSTSFGIKTKIETEEDDFAFCQFCESLLFSEDFEVRINTYKALLSLTENDISNQDIISSNIISHIDKIVIQSNEELVYALKIMTNSLSSNSYVTPFISHLSTVINKFLESTDFQFDDAFCAFIEKIIHNNDTEYIYLLGVVEKIVYITSFDLPFNIKKNVLVILIKIANSCDYMTFQQIISEDVFICLIDFLNTDDGECIDGILDIVMKLIDNKEDVPTNYLDSICSSKPTFISLLSFDNTEITRKSSSILCFIDYSEAIS